MSGDDGELSAVDEFWARVIAEARAAGGRVDVWLDDVPRAPGVAFALPSARAWPGAGKLTLEASDGAVVSLILPDAEVPGDQ